MIKIKEIDLLSAERDVRWQDLRKDLKVTRGEIKVAIEQLIHMRRQLVLYKTVMRQELGVDVRPYQQVGIGKGWRERSMKKSYLKSELISLVSALKGVHPNFHFDPKFRPSSLSSSRDCLLTQDQMDSFADIYENFNACSGRESGIPETIRSYMDMRKEYEARLLQNNAMIDEIKAMRVKMEDLQLQAEEDKRFMNFLVSYKLSGKRPLEKGPEQTVYSSEEVTDPGSTVDCSEALKYRKMWYNNIKEKETMRDCIHQMNEGLNVATERIIEAERLCLLNQTSCQDLELESETQRRNYGPPKSPTDDKTDQKLKLASRFWTKKGELQVALSENNYLRNFLMANVLPSERDFVKLHLNLETTAEKYRSLIEDERRKQDEILELEKAKDPPNKEKPKKKKK